MKITVNWEKAWPAVFIAFLAGLPLLLIAGLIHWRLGWLKAYQQKLASAVGSLRNDSQLNTPKAILIDLIRALPVCLIILAVGLILLTMQLNISELLWSFSKKLAIFWLVFGLCWKVLEKNGVAVRHWYAGTADQPLASANCPHQPRVAADPFLVCGGRTLPAASDG